MHLKIDDHICLHLSNSMDNYRGTLQRKGSNFTIVLGRGTMLEFWLSVNEQAKYMKHTYLNKKGQVVIGMTANPVTLINLSFDNITPENLELFSKIKHPVHGWRPVTPIVSLADKHLVTKIPNLYIDISNRYYYLKP